MDNLFKAHINLQCWIYIKISHYALYEVKSAVCPVKTICMIYLLQDLCKYISFPKFFSRNQGCGNAIRRKLTAIIRENGQKYM